MEEKIQEFSKEFFGKSMEFLNLEFVSSVDDIFTFYLSTFFTQQKEKTILHNKKKKHFCEHCKLNLYCLFCGIHVM